MAMSMDDGGGAGDARPALGFLGSGLFSSAAQGLHRMMLAPAPLSVNDQ